MITTKFFYLIKFLFLLLSTLLIIFILYWLSIAQANERIPFKTISLESSQQKQQPPQVQDHTNSQTDNYDDNLVVIYNRVPKTGSTSFVNLCYDLFKRNHFHIAHINVTGNMHVLSLPNQIKFARNVTSWNAMKPAFYHGHVAYLNFAKFSIAQKPIYINLIRKPLDRLVSYYYFLRYGDDYRPNLVRHRAGDTKTFDECVEQKKPDCDVNNMWLQIPFFCGHYAECWVPGSEWALEQAKINLAREYFLVGVTEQMEEFISLLEISLPRFFHGALDHFHTSNKSHLRKTKSKVEPKQTTIDIIQSKNVWQMENELYEFALEQFQFIRNKYKVSGNKNVVQDFFYEKIKPKMNKK